MTNPDSRPGMHPAKSVLCIATLLALAACGGGGGGSDVTPPVTPVNPLVADAGFGVNGATKFALAPYGGSIYAVKQQADGKLLVAGSRQLDTSQNTNGSLGNSKRPKNVLFVTRLLDSGLPDTSYGNNGTAEFSLRGADAIEDILPMSDGSVLLSAFASEPCTLIVSSPGNTACTVAERAAVQGLVLARLTAQGALDTSPVSAGFVPLQVQSGAYTRLAMQGNKILVLSTSSRPSARIFSWQLGRYQSNGTLDASFGKNGVVTSRCGTDGAALNVTSNQEVWVAGAVQTASFNPPPASQGVCMERLSVDGAPSTLAPNPVNTPLAANVVIGATRLLDDGALLVAGAYYADPKRGVFALKYQPDGSLKTGYGNSGIAKYEVTGQGAVRALGAINVSSTGAVVSASPGSNASGNASTPSAWLSLTPSGSVDARLGNSGVLTQDVPAAVSLRSTPMVDSKGRWLIMDHSVQSTAVDSPATVSLFRTQGIN